MVSRSACAATACFGALAITHLTVFVGLALLMPSVDARLALFSINVLPWQPLHAAGLPVTAHGWLVVPNPLGWFWCVLCWLVIYAGVAYLCTRNTFSRVRRRAS